MAAGADLAALMTDADGRHHPEGIAPQAVSWRCIAAMRQAARERLAPQYAEVVEKTAMPFLQPIFDLVSPRLAFGRVALLGDAAFVARPHTGMGVTKAGDELRVHWPRRWPRMAPRRRRCSTTSRNASPSGVPWSSAAARWVPTWKRMRSSMRPTATRDSAMRQTAIEARPSNPSLKPRETATPPPHPETPA